MGLIAIGSLLTYSHELYERLQIADVAQRAKGDHQVTADTQEGDQQTDTSASSINASPALPNVIAQGDGRISNAEEEQLTYRDVWAQMGMFWAAVGVICVSLCQAGIGWLGIVYIRETLKEAKRTADAAIDAVNVADQTRIDSDRHARQQLRAYVSSRPDFIASFIVGGQLRIRFSIENCGQTPAYDVCHSAVVAILPYPLPTGFPLPAFSGRTSPFTLYPGQKTDGTSGSTTGCTAADIHLLLTNPGYRIYSIGTVFYTDAFKTPRYTNFCRSVGCDPATLSGLTSGGVGPYEVIFEMGNIHCDSN